MNLHRHCNQKQSAYEIEFKATDAYPLKGTRYFPNTPPKAHLIVASATAVPQQFYRRFAEYMAQCGYEVLCFDYRGIGRSAPASLKGFQMNYLDWGQFDLSAAIELMHHPELPLFLVGHSYGGQALGLTSNYHKISAYFNFGTGVGWSGYMPLLQRIKVEFGWNILFPIMVAKDGYLAWSQLNMGADLPIDVYTQWKKWCKTPEYFFADRDLGYLHDQFAQVKTPIFAATSIDDEWAMPVSRDAFMKYYRQAPIQYIDLDPQDYHLTKIGHMGYFKKEATAIWDHVIHTFDALIQSYTPPK